MEPYRCSTLIVAAACALWLSSSRAAADATPEPTPEAAIKPFGDAERAALLGSPEDPPVEHLGGATEKLEGKHYLSGNEWALDRFEPKLRDIGGGYVGIGSDQAYLLLGWTGAELAWLIDYDRLVVQVHDVYFAFFRDARDRKHFLHLWSRNGRNEALAILDAAYQGEQREAAHAIYKGYRSGIERRLTRLARALHERGVASYLSDEAQYARVASAIRAGRVRRMSGNLLDKQALIGIGEIARKLSVPIRVLYLSNAEEYWGNDGYDAQFKANVQGLPFDERSVVLRTLSTWPENKDYRYVAQPARNFVRWLERPWVRGVFQITPRVVRTKEQIASDPYPLTLVEHEPDAEAAAHPTLTGKAP